MNYAITEHDIRSMLREAPKKSLRLLGMATLTVAVIAAAWGTVALLGPANASENPAFAVNSDAPVAISVPAAVSGTPSATATPVPTATPLPVTLPESTFAAADLRISAPITWNVPLETQPMNDGLRNGLIHVEGTAVPGQTGVVAIAGHSSNYSWVRSDYNSVFAPLTKASVGQTYELNYQNTMYQYKVSRIFEVSADETSVLSDNAFTGIRLITCVPVGTSLRRLVVEAAQVFPDPSVAQPFTASMMSGQLPSGL